MKKTIPLGIRKVLEELAIETANNFTIEFEKDSIVTFLDFDRSSNFYFELRSIDNKSGQVVYETRYRPYTSEHLDEKAVNLTIDNFKQHFSKWQDLVIQMNEPSLLFDDNFIRNTLMN